jgi:5-formyltetrahydrofolate cyclo-ligase
MASAGSGRPAPTDLAAAKQALRREFEERRQRIPAGEASRVGIEIAGFLRESEYFRAARRIALFSSIAGEPDMDTVIALALAQGKQVAMPRCEPDGVLAFHVISDISELRRGTFGVLEPPETLPVLSPRSLELVLVPGVAFDLGGGRLGRGRAYYDRTFSFSAVGQLLVGVGYEFQLVEAVPLGSGDRRIEAIVTERGLRLTKAPRNQA